MNCIILKIGRDIYLHSKPIIIIIFLFKIRFDNYLQPNHPYFYQSATGSEICQEQRAENAFRKPGKRDAGNIYVRRKGSSQKLICCCAEGVKSED
jgi:hypothetical protein